MLYAALDLTADRVTGCCGGATRQAPQPLRLDGPDADLPLAISLAERSLRVGRTALAQCRIAPHLFCSGFLPKLGQQANWRHLRHRLDPTTALAAVWKQVGIQAAGIGSLAVAAPAYLTAEQVRLLHDTLQHAQLPVDVMLNRTLAAALASYVEHAWHHVGIIVDVDDHALTCAVVRPRDADLCCLGQHVHPALGRRFWREHVLGYIADSCIQACRRDPRETAEADQQIFDQVDAVLDAGARQQPTALRIQAAGWLQALTVTPSEVLSATSGLARQAALAIQAALLWADQQMTSATIYFTAEAGQLPGLAAAVYQRTQSQVPIVVLSPLAPAHAACDLARQFSRQEIAGAHYGAAAPLPAGVCGPGPTPAAAGLTGCDGAAVPAVQSERDTETDWADMLPFPTTDMTLSE